MTLRKMIRSSGILRSFRSYDITKRRQTYADHLAHTSTGRQHGITDEDKHVLDVLRQLAVVELRERSPAAVRTRARLSGVDSSR